MADLLQHDTLAFEQLFWRYRSTLRAVVLRVLNDESDADDVLQEVFLQLWNRAECYSSAKGEPLGWLVTLARRRAIDRLRQRSAYQRAADRFEWETQSPAHEMDDARAADAEAFRGDLRDLVRGAMLRLPVKQKEVVERAFFDGLSQREIAVKMDLPLGTVKTRIQLGLRKLSSVLAHTRGEIF